MAGASDVVLGSGTSRIPLVLYQDERTAPGVRTIFTGADGQPQGDGIGDVTQRDWSGGMGYSQPGVIDTGYSWGDPVDARSPGMVVPPGEITQIQLPNFAGYAHITDSFTLGTHYYLLCGRYILKMDSGTGTPTIIHDTGSDVIVFENAALARYSGTLNAWIGHTIGASFTRFDGTTVTTSSAFTRGHITSAWAYDDQAVKSQWLYSADTSYSVKRCSLTTDPTTSGNWSAQIVLGEGAYTIGRLVSAGNHVYASTYGGLYDLDDIGQARALTPYHAEDYSTENGLSSFFFASGGRAYVMYTTAHGLDAVDVSQAGMRHPAATPCLPGSESGIPFEGPVFGRPTAWAIDGRWMVVSLYNGDDSYVIYGRRRTENDPAGPGQWIWHGAFAKFEQRIVSHMKVRAVTNAAGLKERRLFIATDIDNNSGGGQPVWYWQSLAHGSTPKQDLVLEGNGHRFYGGFTLYETPQDWGVPSRRKTVLEASIGSERLTGGNAIDVSLSEDAGAYDSVGAATVSPLQRLPTTDDPAIGLQIAPRLTATGTSTNPPILRSRTLRAAVDFEQVASFEFDIWLVKDQPLPSGALNRQVSEDVTWQQLIAAMNSVTTFHHVNDLDYTVLVLPIPPSDYKLLERPAGTGRKGWGRRVTVRLRVLDSGALYGADGLYDISVYS